MQTLVRTSVDVIALSACERVLTVGSARHCCGWWVAWKNDWLRVIPQVAENLPPFLNVIRRERGWGMLPRVFIAGVPHPDHPPTHHHTFMIPEHRRLRWVSEDFPEENSEDEFQTQAVASSIRREWKRQAKYERWNRERYDRLRRIGLNHLRAYVAAYDRMPPKRKAPKGILANYRAKKAKTKSGRDKYGAKGIDWDLAIKVADAAAKKSAIRVQETLYSQSGWFMQTDKSTFVQTGFNLSGLNQSAAFSLSNPSSRADATNQCFVFPVSPLSQLGNQGTPGYRAGQKILAHSLSVGIFHEQMLPTVTATYHVALLRNVSQTRTGTGYATPGITQTNALDLFVTLNQGPLASAGGPSGVLPDGDWSSIMRWNRADWRVCKHETWTMTRQLDGANIKEGNDPTAANGTVARAVGKCHKMYYSFKDQVWDYASPGAINNIKGGDYYVVIWREGPGDSYIGRETLNGVVELAFKDP